MSAQSSISPTTPITVKVTLGADTRRFKIPLNDLGASVFENNLKQLLGIQDKTVVFERWSDSARAQITLDPNNVAIYKQLFRAAKAKLKLRITARIIEEEQPPLLVEPDTASINTANIPPSYSSVNVDQIASPAVPEPTSSQIISPKELKETVAQAVTTYCGSEVFTGQLRETVRDEVHKQSSEASIPDLISLQKSSEAVDLTPKKEEEEEILSSPGFAVYCNSCTNNVKGTYYHCSICQEGDFDVCKICIQNNIHCQDTSHWLSKRELVGGKVTVSDTDFIRKTSPRICNGCAEGIDSRFVSCKSCKDYDLCLPCLGDGFHGHDPLHEFVRCTESLVLTSSQERQLMPGRYAYHAAICDSCQKGIRGIRHKCLDCPDFDFCNSCITSAHVSHPRHRFVPITGGSKWTTPYFNSDPLARVIHYGVYCDGPECTSVSSGECIQGARYKCAICPDTDFCANCEASPLNKHNETHPLIKMRTAIRNVLVTTDDGGEHKMGDPVTEVPTAQPQSEPEKEMTNAATQVHTIVDLEPTEPEQETKAEEKSVPEPAELEAKFVSDTVHDGAEFVVGEEFTQTWIMENNGTTSWPAGITVKFVGGDFMFFKSEEHNINATTTTSEVAPGTTHKFSVNLSATWPPNKAYISYWRLVGPDGTIFGHKLWCSINVKEARRALSEFDTQSTQNDDTSSSKSVADADSVKDAQEAFESVHEDLERSNESHESQMIFPKLPVESPVHSTEHLPSSSSSTMNEVSVPVSPISSHHTLALSDAESIEGDIFSVGDGENFLTDEEYDVLDASDEEFEECERVA